MDPTRVPTGSVFTIGHPTANRKPGIVPHRLQPRRASSRHGRKGLSRGTPGYLWQAMVASALLLIAGASAIGAGFTGWHYWNEEQRVERREGQAMAEEIMQAWERRLQEAEASREELRKLDEALVAMRANASPRIVAVVRRR